MGHQSAGGMETPGEHGKVHFQKVSRAFGYTQRRALSAETGVRAAAQTLDPEGAQTGDHARAVGAAVAAARLLPARRPRTAAAGALPRPARSFRPALAVA